MAKKIEDKNNPKNADNKIQNKHDIDSILVNSKNITKAKEIISKLDKNKRQELKATLKSYETTGYYKLPGKLSDKDITKLLQLLEEEQKNITLYKTDELRPAPWSKTVTVFDVYETDEENFQPYISPLATVGTIKKTSSSSSDETQIPEDQSQGQETADSSGGILGMNLLGGSTQTTQEQGTDEGGLFGWLTGLGK